MATIASRLSNTGTLLVNGSFDEVTFNTETPAINNIFKYTQDFTNAYWFKSSALTITNTSATLAPDKTSTAQLATVGGTGLYPYIKNVGGAVVPCTPGATYTASAYVKYINQQYVNTTNEDGWSGGTSVRFDILNGVVGTPGANIAYANIASAGNGWYRISTTFKPIPANVTYWNPQVIRVGQFDAANYSGSNVYVWGAQLELNDKASIYQGISAANTLVTPTFKMKTVQDAIYSTGQFDEVTLTTGPAERKMNTGTYMVKGYFDEFTGAPVIDNSLLWWYDPAQTISYTGSGTTVRNLANTAQTGTLSANIVYSSIEGGKFIFNDHQDTTNILTAGNIAYPTSVNNPWSVEVWIYIPTGAVWSANNNTGPLYIRGSFAGSHGLLRLQTDNTVAVFIRGNTTALAYQTGTITRDKWNQVVGVWTGGPTGNLQCYINGTLKNSASTTQDDPIDQAFWIIGSNAGIANNTGSIFVGSLSSTKLYSRALTADEVSQNFNALRRRYSV